jgi:surface protein
MANISGLNDSIKTSLKNDFAAVDHGTHVEYGGNGSASTVSRSDHTHSNYVTATTTGSLSSLKTSAKGNLVDAINEVFQSGNSVKQKLVDALIAKGAIGISINDSCDTIINSIGDFKQQIHPDPTKRNSYTFSIAIGDEIVLQPDLRGDPDESGMIETDWGDGVVDTKTSHTYDNGGMYTVQTKWSVVDSEGNYDNATALALREVNGLNSLMDNLSYMFKDCGTLTSFADFEFKTLATTMSHMFENCDMLTTLNLNQWDTSNVKDMTYLFHNCSSLATLNADSWNLSSLLFADFIFSGCSSLV